MFHTTLKPAINLQEVGMNEMSSEEFQRKLYAWFEDRGLLSELRTHLRTQMIAVLRDTAIGHSVSGKLHQSSSPKLQAINLIIAEYLIRQQYHYSLSVFTSEVPLINVLPEISHSIVHNAKFNESFNVKSWHFVPKDTWDLLETIGFLKTSNEGKLVYELYYEECKEEPLLLCILQMLRKMSSVNEKHDIEKPPPFGVHSNQTWIKDIYSILVWGKISEPYLTKICDHIKEIVEKELDKNKEEEKIRQLKSKEELKDTVNRLESEHHRAVVETQIKYEAARLQMTQECQEKHEKISELGATLRCHQNELNERANNLHICELRITNRESDCANREEQLLKQEEQLAEKIAKFKADKIKSENECLRRSEVREGEEINLILISKLREECDKLKQELHATQKIVKEKTNLSESKGPDATQNHIEAISRLQLENKRLNDLNASQESRISELTSRIQIVTEERQQSQKEAQTLVKTTIPTKCRPEDAPKPHARRIASNKQPNSNRPREVVHQSPVRETIRRKPQRRISLPSSSSSEGPSPTEEVLHEARSRLKMLEEESEMVDKLYQQFREKYRRNVFTSASLLSLQQNVDRSEVLPSAQTYEDLNLENGYHRPYYSQFASSRSHAESEDLHFAPFVSAPSDIPQRSFSISNLNLPKSNRASFATNLPRDNRKSTRGRLPNVSVSSVDATDSEECVATNK